jgi:WD40 repeat protein
MQVVSYLRGHEDAILGLGFLGGRSTIVSGCEDRTIRVWNVGQGREARLFRTRVPAYRIVVIGKDRFVTGTADNRVTEWILEGEQDQGANLVLPAGTHVLGVTVSDDRSKVAFSALDHATASVWNWKTKTKLVELAGHTETIEKISFVPGTHKIVTCSWDKAVMIWDSRSGERLATLLGHQFAIRHLAVSPNGKLALTGDVDKKVFVWDLERNALVTSLSGQQGHIKCLAVSSK